MAGSWYSFQSIEYVFFDAVTDDLFVDLNRAGESKRFASPALDSDTQCQIVRLSARCKDFICQVFLLRHNSGITTDNSGMQLLQAGQADLVFIVQIHCSYPTT